MSIANGEYKAVYSNHLEPHDILLHTYDEETEPTEASVAVSESYSGDSPVLLSSDPEYESQPHSLAMIQHPFPMAKAHNRQFAKGKQPLHHHCPSNFFVDQEFSNPSSLSDSDDQSQTYQSPIPSALHLHPAKKEQTRASHPTCSFE